MFQGIFNGVLYIDTGRAVFFIVCVVRIGTASLWQKLSRALVQYGAHSPVSPLGSMARHRAPTSPQLNLGSIGRASALSGGVSRAKKMTEAADTSPQRLAAGSPALAGYSSAKSRCCTRRCYVGPCSSEIRRLGRAGRRACKRAPDLALEELAPVASAQARLRRSLVGSHSQRWPNNGPQRSALVSGTHTLQRGAGERAVRTACRSKRLPERAEAGHQCLPVCLSGVSNTQRSLRSRRLVCKI